MARLKSLSTLEDHMRSKRNRLNDRLKDELDIAAVGTEFEREGREIELKERDPVLDIFNEMDEKKRSTVQADPGKVIENSIFDFVVEMEKQFDDLFSDIDEIKRQERRRKSRV